MVSIPTFLVMLSCIFSVVAVIVSARTREDMKQRRELPEALNDNVAAYLKAVNTLEDRLTSHIKKHASDAGAPGRSARRDGGLLRTPDGAFDYNTYDRMLNEGGNTHG